MSAIPVPQNPPRVGKPPTARIIAIAAWLGLAVAIACAIAELVAGPGYRAGWWPLRAGIMTMRWSAWISAGALAVTLVAAVAAGRTGARRALVAAAHGFVLSALVAGPPLYLWTTLDRLPHIHDISTDTENPPVFVAVMPLRKDAANSTEPKPAAFAQQRAAFPDIAPALLDVPPEQAFQQAERAAKSMGWEIVAAVPQDLRIEATDTTLLFGFKDDVAIRVSPNGTGSRVDVRSESRVGGFDFGVNAQRVRDFMKKLGGTKPAG